MQNNWGVMFIPSYSPDFKRITDIEAAVCDLNTKHMIAGIEHVNDEQGYSHPTDAFNLPVASNPNTLNFDTADCRSRVFPHRDKAVKHANAVLNLWFRTPKHIKYFHFDEGM